MPTRILLCSDEPILARLERIFSQVEGFELQPSCRTVPRLMEQLEGGAPDLLLLDLTPEVTCALLSELKHRLPDMKTVLWVNAISTATAFQAMGLGVRGILRKTLLPELQVKCLKKVQAGEPWFEKAIADGIRAERSPVLTARESQILDLLTQGMKNTEIAAAMSIEEASVRAYFRRLFQKVGAKDRFELALFGLKYRPATQFPAAGKGQRAAAGPGGRDESPARFPIAVPVSM